jgi:hypothetical protein
MQKLRSTKDEEINALKAKLEAEEINKKLAVTKTLSQVEKIEIYW